MLTAQERRIYEHYGPPYDVPPSDWGRMPNSGCGGAF